MRSWKRLFVACTVWLAVVVSPASAGTLSQCDSVAGNLVVNCGFETGSFPPWVVGGNTDYTTVVSSPPYVNSGNYGAEIGPARTNGTLTQTLVGSSQTYYIQFDLYSGGLLYNNFTVFWNGVDIGPDLVNVNQFPFTTYSYTIPGNHGANTLEFVYRQDQSYWGLDDVVVQGVPEPGTWMLLGSGMIALAAVGRRKKSR
jgi:hypothetical protein